MAKRKPVIHLITYTDYRMTISAKNLCESARENGVDIAAIRIPEDLPVYFQQMAGETLNVSRGSGLYIWKPFIIWEYMQWLKDGDILIYADAGQTIVSNIQAVIDSMDQDIMFFSNGWKHIEWCKADVFQYINHDYFTEMFPKSNAKCFEYAEFKQTQASIIFFKVTNETTNFVKEWMLLCLMPGFCDDSPSKQQNYPTFAETRWDQSILCCLQIRDGYKLHWFPTLTAYHIKDEYPNDKYPAIVDHHRKRNEEWQKD